MKKISLLLVMITVLLSCSKDDITGSGNLTSQMRDVEYFTKVKSEGIFKVNIIQGEMQSVEVIADNNILNKVNTRVVDEELRLYLDDGNYQGISLEVNITALRINGLKNSGAGIINVYDVDETGAFEVNNSGSANIFIDGSANSLDIKNEGSGSIMSFDFSVNECHVKIQGSGNVEVSCADYLNLDIEGSGNVYYKGNPIIDADISGSGQIIDDN